MIQLTRKEDCCGCSACAGVCPTGCISMASDGEGFIYPQVNAKACIGCGKCEKDCPVIRRNDGRRPLEGLAAMNKDEDVRSASSSGGMFTLVAEKVLGLGGVVFGVVFDKDWNAVFDWTETAGGLDAMRRSKYVQAWPGNVFQKVKSFLEQGRLVLFTGTPCQVAALGNYLGGEWANLLLMDIICEGVPSPRVWKSYLKEETARQARASGLNEEEVEVKCVSFRNKDAGWKKMSLHLEFAGKGSAAAPPPYTSNGSPYMQALFHYLDLRPICYECPFKEGRSHSDITIADYWGIDRLHPEMDDDRGTSMVHLNTEKGRRFFEVERTRHLRTSYEEAFPYNNVVTPVKRNPRREAFFKRVAKGKNVTQALQRLALPPLYKERRMLRKFIRQNFVLPARKFLKRKGNED